MCLRLPVPRWHVLTGIFLLLLAAPLRCCPCALGSLLLPPCLLWLPLLFPRCREVQGG